MIVDLARLPSSGVYLLLDEVSREFYVGYATNMGASLVKLWGLARGRPTLGFHFLTETNDLDTLRLHTEYYRNMWIGRGYSELVAPGRRTIRYKVRTVVAPGYNHVDVELVNARGEGMVVGRFKTKNEARDFAMVCYGDDNSLRLPVYAANSATKELLLDIRKPGIRI